MAGENLEPGLVGEVTCYRDYEGEWYRSARYYAIQGPKAGTKLYTRAHYEQMADLEALSVTNILLGVEGSHDIHAKSVAEVVQVLTKMSIEVDDLEAEVKRLKGKLTLSHEQKQAITQYFSGVIPQDQKEVLTRLLIEVLLNSQEV